MSCDGGELVAIEGGQELFGAVFIERKGLLEKDIVVDVVLFYVPWGDGVELDCVVRSHGNAVGRPGFPSWGICFDVEGGGEGGICVG